MNLTQPSDGRALGHQCTTLHRPQNPIITVSMPRHSSDHKNSLQGERTELNKVTSLLAAHWAPTRGFRFSTTSISLIPAMHWARPHKAGKCYSSSHRRLQGMHRIRGKHGQKSFRAYLQGCVKGYSSTKDGLQSRTFVGAGQG